MLLCPACIEKEELFEDNMPARIKTIEYDSANPMLNANEKLKRAKEIDNTVQTRSDVFNAETVSIAEIESAIGLDESIPREQKYFKLGEFVTERINKFKKSIFEKQSELVDEVNRLNANQIYLNDLKNKLSVEEREKLKLKDINYKPQPASKPKVSRQVIKKFDKADLKKWALVAGMPESVVQTICIQKNYTPEQASNYLMGIMTPIQETE